jgi:pilus assembly protein CpaE
MNARTYALTDRAVTDCFVLATQADEHAGWLAGSLVSAGAVEPVSLDPNALVQRIGTLNPSLVFVDFSGGRVVAASAAANAARTAYPGLQIVALGSVREPESALAALRAGVRDFIDLCAPAADALRITREVFENIVEPVSRHGKLTAIVGARIGMGVSTLAANLAVLLQRRDAAHGREALLLDLGLPAGDGTLLLNTKCEFGFVEAVRNVRRFDQTFVHTALSHHASGLALTTLPADLGDMREVSHASSVGLLNRLRAFFDQQIVDLGGFTNTEFIANVVQAADETWLVCDQGVPSVVSAVGVLDGLREHGMEAEKIAQKVRLVVSKASPELGLTPAQIAQRLELELIATLPERRVALGQAMNQGHLLAEAAPRDPYVRALDLLVTRLAGAPAEQGADGKPRNAAKAAKVAKATKATKATKADDAADAAMPTPPPRARGKSALDAFRRFLPTSSKRS